MTFIEVLESKHKHLIESLEHGAPADIEKRLIKELYEKTGYKY